MVGGKRLWSKVRFCVVRREMKEKVGLWVGVNFCWWLAAKAVGQAVDFALALEK